MKAIISITIFFCLAISSSSQPQETIRKKKVQLVVIKCGDISFTTSYEPYFENRAPMKDYKLWEENYFEFSDGKLLYLNITNHLLSNVTGYRLYEIDLRSIDTTRLFTNSLNTYSGSGKKKVDNRGWELRGAKSWLCYSDNRNTVYRDNSSLHMDFESYAQFIDFEKELKREWYKAAANYTHIKVLKAMDEASIKDNGKPYLLSLLQDSLFTTFETVVPYIHKANLVTKYKEVPLYNLILLSNGIKRKKEFIKVYHKYDNNLNVQDPDGVTPLLLSLGWLKDTFMLSYLLELGASPFLKSKEEKTVYDYALEVNKQNPSYERIIRNSVINGNYSMQVKLQFCTDYKLVSEGTRLVHEESKKYPDSLQVQYQKAAWNYNARQYPQAINGFTECIRLNKAQVSYYFNRGLSYYALKMNEKAESDFAEAVRRKPSYKEVIETAKKQISAAVQ